MIGIAVPLHERAAMLANEVLNRPSECHIRDGNVPCAANARPVLRGSQTKSSIVRVKVIVDEACLVLQKDLALV